MFTTAGGSQAIVRLTTSPLAPGLLLGDHVTIAPEARLGAHVVLYAGTVLEGPCVVQDNAVIGKAPVLRPGSRALGLPVGERTLVQAAAVGVGAVICAGATVREGAIVGDHTMVREGAVVGAGTVLGNGAAIGWGVELGDNVRVRNNAIIAPATVVEDDVFVGPNVVTTDHNAMSHEPAGRTPLSGAVLRRGCRIGTSAVILPGVELGAGCVVGAGAIVTRDVPPGATVVGAPARVRG